MDYMFKLASFSHSEHVCIWSCAFYIKVQLCFSVINVAHLQFN